MRPRLISRSVLREIWPPFVLGFVAYTFILLIRTILILADFAVRRSAPFAEVARLVLLSLPWIVVLTLPMAFLVGVLVGLASIDQIAGGDDGDRTGPQGVDGPQHLAQTQLVTAPIKGVLIGRDVQVRDLRGC